MLAAVVGLVELEVTEAIPLNGVRIVAGPEAAAVVELEALAEMGGKLEV